MPPADLVTFLRFNMTHGPDPVFILRGSESPVTCLKYLSDETLYSGDQNGSVYTWDIKTKRQSNKISAHSGHSVLWMEFMQNVMVTQGRDGVVQFWNRTEDGWHKSDVIKSAGFGYCPCSLIENFIAVPTDSVSSIELFDLVTKQPIGQLQPDLSQTKYGMCMTTKTVQNKHQILIGYENGCVALWDVRNFKMVASANLHSESVMCLDYCENINLGVSGSADDKLKSWIISNDVSVDSKKKITATNPGFNSILIRPDHKIFAAAGWDSNVRIYSVKKLKPLAVLSYHKDTVQCLAFSSDNMLACGSKDHHISLWDVYK